MPTRPPVYRPPGARTAQEINRERMQRDKGKRTRGRRLQESRAYWLTLHPLCEPCRQAGRVTPAVQVDHIIAVEDGGSDADGENRQSICLACHREKTARERRRRAGSTT
jgi:5-methylcytosine-specific restriction protein A